MRTVLNILAALLIIGWIVGFFVNSAGGIIPVLLVIAVIALLFHVIRRKEMN